MKRSTIILIAVVGIFLLFFMNGCSTYNAMVGLNEGVTAQWQQVENQYQRRMDLIPNIVSTVQGEADFEKSTLQALVEARAKATQVTIDPSNLNEENIAKFKAAQGEISSALGRLLAVAENYPNLKTNAGFADLRVSLEGCENRISNERMKYNNVAQDFNTKVQKFPGVIWARIFGFNKRAYFEAEAGAEKAPSVKFDFNKK
jgi:LemA protein